MQQCARLNVCVEAKAFSKAGWTPSHLSLWYCSFCSYTAVPTTPITLDGTGRPCQTQLCWARSNASISSLLELSWLLLQFRYSLLIPFSFLNSVRESRRGVGLCLLLRNRAAEKNITAERKEENIKNPCKLIKECGFLGIPWCRIKM